MLLFGWAEVASASASRVGLLSIIFQKVGRDLNVVVGFCFDDDGREVLSYV
jgi:hypothetical protein